jgi:HD-GYP domain-containing protein (c-di-GMP phosphodiesterase class II)
MAGVGGVETVKKYSRFVERDGALGGVPSPGAAKPPLRPSGHGSSPPPAACLQATCTESAAAGLAEEMPRAQELRNKAKCLVENLIEDVRLGRSLAAAEVTETVADVVQSLTRNRQALVSLTQLKNRDEYTATHSVNVCILALALGIHLQLPRRELETLGIGAIVHDLGKIRVPLEILNKPGRLNPDEFRIMQKHVLYGRKILEESPGFPVEVMKVVTEHHERPGGDGYPLGLSGDGISRLGQLTAIVDVYDAITSDRVYRERMTPHQAVRAMYRWGAKDFDLGLLQHFIRCLSIYPIGSLVEINHALLGVVAQANPENALKPAVLLFRNQRGTSYSPPHWIDLTDTDPSGKRERWTVTRVLDAGALGIDVAAVLAQPPDDLRFAAQA